MPDHVAGLCVIEAQHAAFQPSSSISPPRPSAHGSGFPTSLLTLTFWFSCRGILTAVRMPRVYLLWRNVSSLLPVLKLGCFVAEF